MSSGMAQNAKTDDDSPRVTFRTKNPVLDWLNEQADADGRKLSGWIHRHFQGLMEKRQTRVDKSRRRA